MAGEGQPAETIEPGEARTIQDFGAQWTRYTDNTGYYGSTELLADFLNPLVELDELKGQRVAEIGSGTGRIVNMLIEAGAASVVAVEPSAAFHVLRQNTQHHGERVQYIHAAGEALAACSNLDFVVSIGVLHHIENPGPVVAAAFQALRPGGTLVAWVYGWEGNESYVRLVEVVRKFTVWCPDSVLTLMAKILTAALDPYLLLAQRFRVPLRDYLISTFSKLSRDKRELVIFDQLNPAYAKYYTRAEVVRLLESSGFVSLRLHHRHGYSWTARAAKPGDAA